MPFKFNPTNGKLDLVNTSHWTKNGDDIYYNDGKVGLGTITPTARLDIFGSASTDFVKSAMGFCINIVIKPASITGVISAGGSVNDGNHYYLITYVTAMGETDSRISAIITTGGGNNTVTLTIPVSTDPRVTSRNIYRTKAGEGGYLDYFLVTIANNTDTSYVDTAADATLTGNVSASYFRPNTTSNYITVGGDKAVSLDSLNTIFGINAGVGLVRGGRNLMMGAGAGYQSVSSYDSVFLGYQAGYGITGGSENVCIGAYTGRVIGNAVNNTAVGAFSQFYATANNNTSFGNRSLFAVTSGSYNTAIGLRAGYTALGSYNVYLGNFSGYWETNDSYRLIIDSLNRNNQADSRTRALIYGVFDFTPANQILVLGGGGKVGIGITPTAGLHLKAGTATASTAPLKFTSGVNLTTPEAGAMEFSNDRLYFTNVATRRALDRTSDVALATVTVANTTTETTVFTGLVPANSLKAGNILKLIMSGILSTASTADICTINVYVGSDLAATIDSPGKNLTDACWSINGYATLRSVGETGSMAYILEITSEDDKNKTCQIMTVDTTVAENITVKVQWNNAKAGNTISLTQGFLEYKN